MIVKIDEPLEFEFDQWSIEQAADLLQTLRTKHPERANDVTKSLLGLLIFGQLEHKQPGTIDRLFIEIGKVSETLKGPKPREANS